MSRLHASEDPILWSAFKYLSPSLVPGVAKAGYTAHAGHPGHKLGPAWIPVAGDAFLELSKSLSGGCDQQDHQCILAGLPETGMHTPGP